MFDIAGGIILAVIFLLLGSMAFMLLMYGLAGACDSWGNTRLGKGRAPKSYPGNPSSPSFSYYE